MMKKSNPCQTSEYAKSFKYDQLLKEYNKIQDKVSKIIKKGFDSKPVYNAKYRKTKTKSYIGTINTNFL